jgi:hypothetical protein
MKHQWKIHREVQEYLNGQYRWDRAYLLLMEIAQSSAVNQWPRNQEVCHASSDLCESIDLPSNARPDH